MDASVESVAEGLGLRVVRRLAGGEWGAYLAKTTHGQDVVLKLPVQHPRLTIEWVTTAVQLATTLREKGCPVPCYLDVGTTHGRVFTVQEAVEGVIPERLRSSHVRQLIEGWRQQPDLAATSGVSGRWWVPQVLKGLRSGSELVYIDHAVLRGCDDARVRQVLEAAIAIGEATDPGAFRTGDAVHADLHHRNLLVRGDEIVAVFDWEGAHAGDARFDLLRLEEIPPHRFVEPELASELIRAELAATRAAEIRAAVHALGALQSLTFAVRSKPDAFEQILRSARSSLLRS